MTAFRVGDTVRLKPGFGSIIRSWAGSVEPEGIVVKTSFARSSGIKWNFRFRSFHDLGGLCEYGYGFYVNDSSLVLVYEPYDPNQEGEDDCV